MFSSSFLKGNTQEKNITKNSQKLYLNLEKNIQYISEEMAQTDDLVIRDLFIHKKKGKILFLETMVDIKAVEEKIIKPITTVRGNKKIEKVITNIDYELINDLNVIAQKLVQGNALYLLEDEKMAYAFISPQENSRSPDEPENEKAVRGSHIGFVENLDINMNLIRRQIRNSQLKIRYFKVGYEANTKVAMVYMNNIANDELIKKLEKKIQDIPIDMVFSPGFLEEYIEEKSFSPFPQNLYTERPDRAMAHITEGRVVLMGEGSTDAIIMPVTFFSFFQTTDDYNNRFYQGSFFRMIRMLSFWGSLLLPSLYIAIIVFHFELIPYEMITLVKNSIESVPFPPFYEALFMVITIELIREAGLRLPSPIGETIGIVGGLIIGEAVVNAGFVSNVMVIVIALTAIMSFTAPSYEMGNIARLLSFPIMISAALLGFVGIVFSLLFIIMHMCKLQSYGTPYLSPLVPINFQGLKDSLVRLPIIKVSHRPKEIFPEKIDKKDPSEEWDLENEK